MTTLDDLAAALDETGGPSLVTSVRRPEALHRALLIAVELGLVGTATEAQGQALRELLEAVTQRAALEQHYAAHPESRPTLAEVALALAEAEHSPLAQQPELLEQAAREVLEVRPDADPDDVLVWAACLSRHLKSGTRQGRRR